MPHTVASLCSCLAAALGAAPPAGPPGGQVTLPLDHWSTLVRQLEDEPREPEPPAKVAWLERELRGRFDKGLLAATLTARFQVLADGGHLRVPVVDATATPREVQLNDAPATLVARDGMYTVGVDEPGVYTVRVELLLGREQDRFARRLEALLPPGGVTRLAIWVPERGIDARLSAGAVTAAEEEGDDGTLVEGYLDASGRLDLSWRRKLTHRRDAAVRAETRLHTLFTLGEAMVSGVAVFDVDVLEGEIDRLDLRLPRGVEVTGVHGEPVLQWRTHAGEAQGLTVLLRYLVGDELRVAVHFQYAAEAGGAAVPLAMPLPAAGSALTGALGIQAPPGLEVTVAEASQATELQARDLPPVLSELTGSPLLFGFGFTAPPEVSVRLARHATVELTSTLVDEVEASTVIVADGTIVTKAKLHIRNNTRQYLRVGLPAGSTLTHALLDGHPVRPARDGDGLLFSLRQSERIDPEAGRTHLVRPGDTLGSLALRYFSDPGRWPLILEANRQQLPDEWSLAVGQELAIPSEGPVTVEESSFVLELAWEHRGDALGDLGQREVALPTLDVDAMKVVWYLYLPQALMPLSFEANLTQRTRLRYGTFRRALQFLREVFTGTPAWAGGDGYTSILSKRKVIYRQAVERRGMAEVAPVAFPLVGERYIFKRLLADREQPRIAFSYASGDLVRWLRWGALGLAFGLGLLVLRRRRRWWGWLAAGLGFAALLLVAHYVLGVHRRMVWGVDLALLVALWQLRHVRRRGVLKELLWSPWELTRLITLRHLAMAVGLLALASFVLSYPLLLSLVTGAALLVWWRRWSARADALEAAHATA